MDTEGVVRNGIIMPDSTDGLAEGTRVRIVPAQTENAATFGQRFAQFKGAVTDLPEDLASQHEHYRLGTPKR